MIFEELLELYENFVLYKEGREYQFKQAPVYIEKWVEEKAFNIENESMNKDYQ